VRWREEDGAGEDGGRRPDRRLRLLAAVIAVPLLSVLVRLADVQADLDADGTSAARRLKVVEEPIPARDGRILSSDGRVLAEDVETFAVLLHYRWLERPPDPRWLRGEALRSLKPSQRRDPAAVHAAEEAVLKRREELWGLLSETTGLSQEELFRSFAAVQEKVVVIRKSVEAHAKPATPTENGPTPATWWEAAASAAWTAVTTPPRRENNEPIVLAEEVEHYPIATGLALDVAAKIEADRDRFPATRVRGESRRRYPQGASAAHVIGYRHERSGPEVEETGVRTVGQTGIERAYDRHLRGTAGLRRVWLDRRGETVRSETAREPRVGRDLVLHLDAGLQSEIERRLDQAIAAVRKAATKEAPVPETAGGCVVVIDVRTGGLLAAASAPRFDLAKAAARDASFWRDVSNDPARPLFDRVASAALPPGSVYKVVSSVALLESGKIDPDEPFECVGYLDRSDRHRDYIYRHFGTGHGPTTLTTALAESCNVYFFRGAKMVGAGPLIAWGGRLGFGRATGVDLPSESAGHLPRDPRNADALGLAIGQADLTATPLQLVRTTAAVANGGRLVTPHVVRGSGSARSGDDPARPFLTTDQLEGLKPDTLARIREGMGQVVSHPRGSGYKTVRHPAVAIAGKTGTAESGGGRPDHAWFAGYAPADDPQVAFVVLLEHAGSGGQAAGPLARATVDALLKRGLLRE
jgi:penicillin-binding protein 2